MKYLPWIFVIIYFLLPYDVFPDFLGPLGRLDDFLLALYVLWRFRGARLENNYNSFHSGPRPEVTQGKSTVDPFQVLGVSRQDNLEEIKKRYKELIRQYHPDKVAHLGSELQELAHQKAIEIKQAWESVQHEMGGEIK